MLKEADIETFEVMEHRGEFAKDKNNYFVNDEIVSEAEFKERMREK